LGVPRVVIVLRFDCKSKFKMCFFANTSFESMARINL
jgi:hypothetical protein